MEFVYLADHPDQVPTVIRWWQTVWADRMGETEQAEKILLDSLGKSELPVHVLAMIDGKAVGTAALKNQELADLYPNNKYWLGSVFVDEAHRGYRVASALTEHIADLAKQRQLPHLYLQTIKLTGGLYAKLGWQALEEFESHGERSLLMLRKFDHH